MPAELGLTGQQPNIALAIFFVPYIVFEIPSNILMKRLSPHVWLSFCVLGFGIAELCQGFVQNYSGLIATRFFLGLFEAGIFPGSFYLISFWYKREESQKRFTIYFCSVILASAFGGLLASAIAKMDGMQGKSNWRWIFILEGILTIVVAMVSFFGVSDFPDDAAWLSPRERRAVLNKTRAESVGLQGKVTRQDLARFFSDPKNYLAAVMYFCKPCSPKPEEHDQQDLVLTRPRSRRSHRRAGLCIRLLYTNNCQVARIQRRADAASLGAPIRRRLRTVPGSGLLVGSNRSAAALCAGTERDPCDGACHLDNNTFKLFSAVCRDLPGLYGRIGRGSRSHLLVPHELDGAQAAKHWVGVDDQFW
jgi:MFS family permease